MPRATVFVVLPSAGADCGRFVAEPAHRVRSTFGSVAPEGGGKQVPTQGGGCTQVMDALASTSEEMAT
jgi:hypothetical protein